MELHLRRVVIGLVVVGVGLLIAWGAELIIKAGWWILPAAVASFAVVYLIGVAGVAILERMTR